MLNDLRNPWFVTLLEGLTTATLDAVGIAPILADSHLDQRVGRDTVETLLSQRVDGLVVVGTTDAGPAIERASVIVPVVLAGTHEPNLPHIDIAADDDVAGARLAPQHLLDLGHRRIGHLAGPGIAGSLRRTGFMDAMSAAGCAEVATVELAGMTEEGGYAAATDYLIERNVRRRSWRSTTSPASAHCRPPMTANYLCRSTFRWSGMTTRILRASDTCR